MFLNAYAACGALDVQVDLNVPKTETAQFKLHSVLPNDAPNMPILRSLALTAKYRFLAFASLAVVLFLSLWAWRWPVTTPDALIYPSPVWDDGADPAYPSAAAIAHEIRANPPGISEFGKMGKTLQQLKEWTRHTETAALSAEHREKWSQLVEGVAISLLPFLQAPHGDDSKPLERLRGSFVPGSKGLVITTGKKRFRYACHLVVSLRRVLKSQLPIQIAYSGEKDLPREYREFITSLAPDVLTFDVTALFDDRTLDLPNGGWAVKAFAMLGSSLEQVLLLDADDVFLQPPEVLFNAHPQYLERGNMLFHDRLLWQGAFKERHEWWEKELNDAELSDTIKQSKVFMEGYAEEGDSGVVAADKSRLDVVTGLLHIAWQNTKEVRETFTYRRGHGDKESWWFGFELTGTPYSMETHYAAITGHVKLRPDGSQEDRVCSFTIAHVDHKSRLLWFNGSLLKNKEIDSGDFDVPQEWMVDGTWEKGATKQDMSCMSGERVRPIDESILRLLQESVQQARNVDDSLHRQIPEAAP